MHFNSLSSLALRQCCSILIRIRSSDDNSYSTKYKQYLATLKKNSISKNRTNGALKSK